MREKHAVPFQSYHALGGSGLGIMLLHRGETRGMKIKELFWLRRILFGGSLSYFSIVA